MKSIKRKSSKAKLLKTRSKTLILRVLKLSNSIKSQQNPKSLSKLALKETLQRSNLN